MRILVAALGSPGHLFPLVPLACALRDAGHEVVVASTDEVAAAIDASGLERLSAGTSMGPAFREAFARLGLTERPTDPAVIGQVAGEAFGAIMPRAFIDDLGPWIERRRPDLVIAEAGCPGAALAALRSGVPCVVHSFGRRPDRDGPMGGAITAGLRALVEETGMALESDVLGHAYLDICPPSIQASGDEARAQEIPLRPTAWSPPTPFTDRRRDPTRPWVYLTLGTAMGDAVVLRTAVEGLRRLDVEVLLAAGSVDAGELADLDGRVQVEPFVPQAALMDRFALVVHHGGSGTTLGAATAGRAQLFLPQGADQFANADAVTAVGAGVTLTTEDVSADAVADAVGRLLGDGPQAAAEALACEIDAMPTPAEVAARVEDWGRP